MLKPIDKMNNDELWHLFPIILKPYNPLYHQWFLEEKKRIIHIVGRDNIFRISHIGSTAVHGLLGKPTVDILLEVVDLSNIEDIKVLLSKLNDYRCLVKKDRYNHSSLLCLKGYSDRGFLEQVFHIHVRLANNHRELYFRDYLRENSRVAQAYGDLKIELLKKYKYHRENYTNKKSVFIDKYTEIAKNQYPGRYKVISDI